jgi:hypothetical protein
VRAHNGSLVWALVRYKWARGSERRHLVATSPEATWHLVLALENGGGGVVSTHDCRCESFTWGARRCKWARR